MGMVRRCGILVFVRRLLVATHPTRFMVRAVRFSLSTINCQLEGRARGHRPYHRSTINYQLFNMSDKTFDFSPTVELLQLLARGSLRQNLPKAVRLWVILRSHYGGETDPLKLQLGETFTYSNWSQKFFTETDQHHKDYTIPRNHDPQCPCAKTISYWLFESDLGVSAREWQQSFLKLYPMPQQDLERLLSAGIIPEEKKGSKQKYLPEGRLFAVTSKNLQYDFNALVEMGWLRMQKVSQGKSTRLKTLYSRIEEFPNLAIDSENISSDLGSDVSNMIPNDLADFFEDFGRKINGEQRFFLDIEYIVHRQLSQQINEIRKQLKEIWHQSQISPIKISYVSARNFQHYQDEGEQYIVYPVCIYYSHRAPYLFAFGQSPRNESKIDWYDYRLDRIQSLQKLKWDEVNITNFSWGICQSKTPKQIESLRAQAWGFDFYKPHEVLLLRFDRYFHSRYIEGTEREEIFKQITYKQAQTLIANSDGKAEQKQLIVAAFQARSKSDIYCRVNYRVGDNNAIMRLRAWGPEVEVFLPSHLREIMADDIEKTRSFYRS
jgi:CRISPR-associated protein (TIGR03985 family)